MAPFMQRPPAGRMDPRVQTKAAEAPFRRRAALCEDDRKACCASMSTDLDEARRQIAAAETSVDDQRQIVSSLVMLGRDATHAEVLLKLMEELLAALRQQLSMLEVRSPKTASPGPPPASSAAETTRAPHADEDGANRQE